MLDSFSQMGSFPLQLRKNSVDLILPTGYLLLSFLKNQHLLLNYKAGILHKNGIFLKLSSALRSSDLKLQSCFPRLLSCLSC